MQRTIRYQGAVIRDHHILLIQHRHYATGHSILELTEVEIRPFNQVDAQFAYNYGEYGRTLEQWRVASWAYFSEVCVRIGREPSETMPMVCQRFRRVYPA